MFLKDSWSIAALSSEVTRLRSLARTIMNEPVVMYRKLDGSAVALVNKCPHRFAPLSLGRVVGDTLVCGYHGMTFDAEGRCIANPTQAAEKIPPAARVRSFPLVERHGFLWIWMGEPGNANPDLIPDYSYYDDPEWASAASYMHVSANYFLLVDNLLDLTHIAYVHADVLGNPAVVDQPSTSTRVDDYTVTECRFVKDAPAVPAWKAAFDDYEGNVDLWMDMYWSAGSNLMLDVGVTPTGAAREDGIGIMGLDCLTPETETTTHYFYGAARRYRIDEPAVTAFWLQALDYAFDQDRRMIEAVQKNMGGEWDILSMKPVINKADRAALHARRIVARLIKAQDAGAGDAANASGKSPHPLDA